MHYSHKLSSLSLTLLLAACSKPPNPSRCRRSPSPEKPQVIEIPRRPAPFPAPNP